MNKNILCIFLLFSINAQENDNKIYAPRPIHHSREMQFDITPNEMHLTIDIPDRPDNPEPQTPQDIKKLKIKVAAITAIVTALIGAGVSIYLGVHNCK